MIEQNFALHDFIQVSSLPPKDVGWPVPSPFNLKFKSQELTDEQSTAISGSGLYMISKGDEVIYVGLYRPQKGNIIADRWGRHLQTITGRGYNIGLGGRNPEARRDELLDSVSADGLRQAIEYSYLHSREERYKDTGYNTTPNRLRFASENWDIFGQDESARILRSMNFWLFRIRVAATQEAAAKDVKAIEKSVLGSYKPVCNKQYIHSAHAALRRHNTVNALTEAIRSAALTTTGQDVTHRLLLEGLSVTHTRNTAN